MLQDLFPSLFIAFVTILSGFMFLKGFFHEDKNTRFRRIVDIDKIFFPKLSNLKLITFGDRLAFVISIGFSLVIVTITIANVAGAVAIGKIVNINAALLLLSVFVSWVARLLFITAYRNKPIDKVPSFWKGRKAG